MSFRSSYDPGLSPPLRPDSRARSSKNEALSITPSRSSWSAMSPSVGVGAGGQLGLLGEPVLLAAEGGRLRLRLRRRRQRAAGAPGAAGFALAAGGLPLVGAPSSGDGRRPGAHRRDPADGRAR